MITPKELYKKVTNLLPDLENIPEGPRMLINHLRVEPPEPLNEKEGINVSASPDKNRNQPYLKEGCRYINLERFSSGGHKPTIRFDFDDIAQEVHTHHIEDLRPGHELFMVTLDWDENGKNPRKTGLDDELNQKFSDYLDEFNSLGYQQKPYTPYKSEEPKQTYEAILAFLKNQEQENRPH